MIIYKKENQKIYTHFTLTHSLKNSRENSAEKNETDLGKSLFILFMNTSSDSDENCLTINQVHRLTDIREKVYVDKKNDHGNFAWHSSSCQGVV